MRASSQFHAVSWQRVVATVVVALLLWAGAPVASAQAVSGVRVDLKVLLLADGNSQTAAIATQMDREGVPYTAIDLGDAERPVIDDAFLADAATGWGRYQAIVLPNQWGTGLSAAELTALHTYERSYGVRQVNAYVYPGASTGQASPTFSGTLDGAVATVTSQGLAGPFTYLNSSLAIDNFDPAVAEAYGYLAEPSLTLPAGETFTPLVDATLGAASGTLIGVYAYDFREELVITASYNSNQEWFNEVAHGVVTWMTRGLHLGYHRNYLSVDVDDVFVGDGRWNATENCTPGDVVGVCDNPPTTDIRMIPTDVDRLTAWQTTNDFRFNMLFNAQGSVDAEATSGGTDPLTESFLAVKDQFAWVNHTYSHTFLGCIQIAPTVAGENWRCATPSDTGPYYDPDLVPDSETLIDGIRWLSQAKIESQISLNQQWAIDRQLPNFDPAALVTGEHAGLLTLPQQPIDNPLLAPAMSATGITYTGSDASREASSRLVEGSTTTRTVPRHPMNIFYNVATYGEEVDEYNWIYTSAADGGSGICSANPSTSTCIVPLANADATQAQTSFTNYIVPLEVRNAYKYVITGDARPFYAHQSNFAEDGLLFPVVEGILNKYKGTYDAAKSPLVTTDLVSVGQALNRMTSWTGAQDGVTAYVDAEGVHVSGPTGTPVPLTVPTGTTVNGAALAAYDGELSGWQSASTSDTIVAEPTTPMGGYVGYTVPSAPVATATSANASAVVSWTAPESDGNSPVTGYGVDYSSDGGSTWTTAVAASAGVTARTYTVTGLTNGTSYVFRVAAANAVGTGGWSVTSAAVTPQVTVPGQVSGVVGSNVTSSSIDVSWAAPDNGGSPILQYSVRFRVDGVGPWQYTSVSGNPAGTSLTVTGLPAGTSYVFQVTARNAIGWAASFSASSAPVSTLSGSAPSVPTNVAGVAGNTTVALTWSAPSSSGGSPVTGYGVDYSSDGGSTWTTAVAASAGVTARTYTVTGLTNGTSYVFRVAAANAVGTGGWSVTSAAVTPQVTVPGQVSGVVGSNVTSSSIDVSWAAPDNGGSPILQYSVRFRVDGVGPWQYTSVSGNPAGTSLTVTGLPAGTSYVFQVTARNAIGWAASFSASSAPVSTLS